MSGKIIPGLPFNSDIVELGIKKNLSPSEVLLLFVLRMRMKEKNKKCWPSQKTLADEVRVTEAWVRSMIRKLVKKGIIEVSKRKKRSRYGNNLNEYRLKYPWELNENEENINPVLSQPGTEYRYQPGTELPVNPVLRVASANF